MSGKRATIYDVATAAGVAIKTVSRVVNKESGVSERTRQRVEEVIVRLDYRPNRDARSLASAQSYFLALLFDEDQPDLVPEVQRGMIAACREGGHHLIAEAIDIRSPNLASSVQALLATSRPDGVLMVPPVADSPELLALLVAANVRHARISAVALPGAHLFLPLEDADAAAAITACLIGNGHRRIACIRCDDGTQAGALRYEGFGRAMAAAGLPIEYTMVESGDGSFSSGMLAASVLINQPAPPTAIFASSDEMALGVLSAANRMRIAVPDQLSVCGFGDTLASRNVWPSLATVGQPVADMAQHAARWLLRAEVDCPSFAPVVSARDTIAAIRFATVEAR